MSGNPDRPLSSSGGATPRTVVEKVDPELPSHGDVPGTPAYDARTADTPPDLILKATESHKISEVEPSHDEHDGEGDTPVPETLLSRVDSLPTREAGNSVAAHKRTQSDALPDSEERIEDTSGKTRAQFTNLV